jgi:hypothetical protein
MDLKKIQTPSPTVFGSYMHLDIDEWYQRPVQM